MAAAALFFIGAAPGQLHAQALPSLSSDEPVLIQADEVEYSDQLDIVIARGNVEVAQGPRIVRADTLTYNRRDGIVTAQGNVAIVEPDGSVLFASYAQLDEELAKGVARDLRARLADQTLLAAAGSTREGRFTRMDKAAYTACELCEETPDRPPLWQLKADTVTHDEQTRDIVYRDATLELLGVPVIYTPYFSHPDPTVDRRSGVLAPTYRSNSTLGSRIDVPYHIVIDPSSDATVTPIWTTDQGAGLGLEYRRVLDEGAFSLEGLIADASDDVDRDNTRGYIAGRGRFDINRTWRWGFDGMWAGDDTVLRVYDISNRETLTSTLYAEQLNGRDYALIAGYWFQGLRSDQVQSRLPIAVPMAQWNQLGAPGAGPMGGQWRLDSSFAGLTRREGTDSYRMTVDGGWNRSFIGAEGGVYTVATGLRGDGYMVDDVQDGTRTFDGTTGRVVPEVSLDWRLPMVRSDGAARQVIEPIVHAVLSPYGGNPAKIPNEDSRDFEFDETNLFENQRFAGYDRVEGGPRVSYGMRLGHYTGDGGQITGLIGQSLRARADDTFSPGSGLDDKVSDYVGRVVVTPDPNLNLYYRFRFDKDTLEPRRTDLGASWIVQQASFDLSYILLQADEELSPEDADDREEVYFSAGYDISDDFKVFGSLRRDLENERSIDHGVGVAVDFDNCLYIVSEVRRSFSRDRDVQPSTDVLVRVVLRTLGGTY
ncbi:LPS-assembly protein LptD [Tistrella bauzanensis]|uniref:LPS-assembly protein LptD n=1 Tax=Tistrella bauzanensis TaxID=657419 RepID=A0ABQ1ITA7_9PROT|nr:LPS assembly protein LptD [Tistrella bauzanensis]GGB50677.1 LPS-assembly protein LptD [Tistrella bauzanensis]